MSPSRETDTYREHLISLVKDEHLHGVGLENTTLYHVLDTAWSSDYNLGSSLESLHIISDAGASNASVAVDGHEVSDGNDDFLDLLSQFAGGCKDQSLAGLHVGIQLL